MEGAIEPLGHWAAFLTNETSGKVSSYKIIYVICLFAFLSFLVILIVFMLSKRDFRKIEKLKTFPIEI